MGNTFESGEMLSYEDHGNLLSLGETVCRENKSKCQKLAVEPPGEAPVFGEKILSEQHVNALAKKAPIFGKGKALSQPPPVNAPGKKAPIFGKGKGLSQPAVNAPGKKAPIFGKGKPLSQPAVNAPGKKAPIFGKGKALPQVPVNAADKMYTGTSQLSCSQLISERLRSPKGQGNSFSGERESTPGIDAKDKKYWYHECKHQKGKVRRLAKELGRSNAKLRKISKELKVLLDIAK
jgi:hypothetical protein